MKKNIKNTIITGTIAGMLAATGCAVNPNTEPTVTNTANRSLRTNSVTRANTVSRPYRSGTYVNDKGYNYDRYEVNNRYDTFTNPYSATTQKVGAGLNRVTRSTAGSANRIVNSAARATDSAAKVQRSSTDRKVKINPRVTRSKVTNTNRNTVNDLTDSNVAIPRTSVTRNAKVNPGISPTSAKRTVDNVNRAVTGRIPSPSVTRNFDPDNNRIVGTPAVYYPNQNLTTYDSAVNDNLATTNRTARYNTVDHNNATPGYDTVNNMTGPF